MMYVIKHNSKKFSDGEPHYWNERIQKWGLRMDATVFTYEQMRNYPGWLPLGGEWVKL